MYAAQLVGGLRDKGIDVLTVTRGDRNEYCDKVIRFVTPDVLYWRRFFFINKAINLFHRMNKSWKFDLVHLNGAYPIMQGLKLPTVCTFHSTDLIQFVSGFRSLRSVKTLQDKTSLLFGTLLALYLISSQPGCRTELSAQVLVSLMNCNPIVLLEVRKSRSFLMELI